MNKAIEEGAEIPSLLKELACKDASIAPSRENYREPSPSEKLAATSGESPQILLTKPGNAEQLAIAQKLEHNQQMLVQGPPGTGKTHTIANLMGHFLAQGKRILVTSEKLKALSVLKEKLSPELQNLCISYTGNAKADQIETTIAGLQARLASTYLPTLRQEIEQLTKQREETISELSSIRERIYEQRSAKHNTIEYMGHNYSLIDLAKKLKDEEAISRWIVGPVAISDTFLTPEELQTLYGNAERWTPEEIEHLKSKRVPVQDLLSPKALEQLFNHWKEVRQALTEAESKRRFVEGYAGQCVIQYGDEPEVKLTKASLERLEKFDLDSVPRLEGEAFEKTALLTGMNPLSQHFVLGKLVDERLGHVFEAIAQYQKEAFEAQLIVSFPSLENLETVAEAASWFAQHRPDGTLGLMDRFLGKAKTYQAAIQGITVNLKAPSSAQAFNLIASYAQVQIQLREVEALWEKSPFSQNEDINASGDLERFVALMKPRWTKFRTALHWWTETGELYEKAVMALGLEGEGITAWREAKDTETRLKALMRFHQETHLPHRRLKTLKLEQDELQLTIKRMQLKIKALVEEGSIIMQEVLTALSHSIPRYQSVYGQLCRFEQEQTEFVRYCAVLAKVDTFAPQWKKAIEERREGFVFNEAPSELFKAWEWHQLDARFKRATENTLESLQADEKQAAKKQRDLTISLAAAKAWYAVFERVSGEPELMGQLTQLAVALKKGQRKGRNALKFQMLANTLLNATQKAIPVWVMPIAEAVQKFDAKTHFDVLIIDEASQASLTALPLLFWGAKVIVIGDDKQVTPTTVGRKLDGYDKLVARFIKDKVKNPSIYLDPDVSLYDFFSQSGCPRVMLTEHFRCVPDIIGWCNKTFYDGQMKPLRDSSSTILTPPWALWRVNAEPGQSGFIEEEATAAIRLIRAMIDQPEYAGKTFGIIVMKSTALDSSAERKFQTMILNAFSETEITERQITFGTSAEFQGDERDVILMCLMDVPKAPGEPLSKLRDTENKTYEKRFNVAVSRARDQLWLIHSFDWENQLKSDDLRRRLFEWVKMCAEKTDAQKSVTPAADSPFEIEVGTALKIKGYDIEQQHAVGGFRLDFVVRDHDKAVALECDGVAYHSGTATILRDMERQSMLERVGWRFVRISGADYYRDPEGAMAMVYKELEALGIKPSVKTERAPETNDLLARVRQTFLTVNADGSASEGVTLTEAVAVNSSAQEPEKTQAPNSVPSESLKTEANECSENVLETAVEVPIEVLDEVPVLKTVNEAPLAEEEAVEPQLVREEASKVAEKPKAKTPAKRVTKASKATPAKKTVSAKLTLFDELDEEPISSVDEIIFAHLAKAKMDYIDKRASGGALWVPGKWSNKAVFDAIFEETGCRFTFAQKGGRLTGHKPAWYSKASN